MDRLRASGAETIPLWTHFFLSAFPYFLGITEDSEVLDLLRGYLHNGLKMGSMLEAIIADMPYCPAP